MNAFVTQSSFSFWKFKSVRQIIQVLKTPVGPQEATLVSIHYFLWPITAGEY